jgi:hypothetical protein
MDVVPSTPRPQAAPGPALLASLQRMVVKQHLHLGSLRADERMAALSCVWAALPAGDCSEPEINARLRAALADAAAWLDTDHVELRRWLVDAGWLQRDGYGRVYTRPAVAALPAPLQACAQALLQQLGGQGMAAWVQGLRSEQAARRMARRRAWQQAGA